MLVLRSPGGGANLLFGAANLPMQLDHRGERAPASSLRPGERAKTGYCSGGIHCLIGSVWQRRPPVWTRGRRRRRRRRPTALAARQSLPSAITMMTTTTTTIITADGASVSPLYFLLNLETKASNYRNLGELATVYSANLRASH